MQDKDTMDDIFDEMIAKRHQIALNAGFENFRDYQHTAMQRYDYSPDDCATFHDAIEQVVVPLRRRLDAERAGELGVDPLRPWDGAVDVKGRNPLRPFETAEELARSFEPSVPADGPAAGGLLRFTPRGRLPRPRDTQGQGARRLPVQPGLLAQALHLHERRRTASRSRDDGPRGGPCISFMPLRSRPPRFIPALAHRVRGSPPR